jgi:hypothetical protein
VQRQRRAGRERAGGEGDSRPSIETQARRLAGEPTHQQREQRHTANTEAAGARNGSPKYARTNAIAKQQPTSAGPRLPCPCLPIRSGDGQTPGLLDAGVTAAMVAGVALVLCGCWLATRSTRPREHRCDPVDSLPLPVRSDQTSPSEGRRERQNMWVVRSI